MNFNIVCLFDNQMTLKRRGEGENILSTFYNYVYEEYNRLKLPQKQSSGEVLLNFHLILSTITHFHTIVL